jgi:hypothetical protein
MAETEPDDFEEYEPDDFGEYEPDDFGEYEPDESGEYEPEVVEQDSTNWGALAVAGSLLLLCIAIAWLQLGQTVLFEPQLNRTFNLSELTAEVRRLDQSIKRLEKRVGDGSDGQRGLGMNALQMLNGLHPNNESSLTDELERLERRVRDLEWQR